MVVVFGVIHHHAPFLLLRDVHGDVGTLQQRLRIGAVGAGDDHSDPGVDVEVDAFDAEGFGQVAADNYLERRIAASELLLALTCCLT